MRIIRDLWQFRATRTIRCLCLCNTHLSLSVASLTSQCNSNSWDKCAACLANAITSYWFKFRASPVKGPPGDGVYVCVFDPLALLFLPVATLCHHPLVMRQSPGSYKTAYYRNVSCFWFFSFPSSQWLKGWKASECTELNVNLKKLESQTYLFRV